MAKTKAAKVIWLVGAECAPEKENEFNQWYNKTHVPLALKLPGMLGATRFERMENDERYPKFLVIYEMEDEAVMERIARGEGMEALQKDAQENNPKFEAKLKMLVHYKRIGP